MTWFAVYETATGFLRSSGSRVADTLPSGLAVKEFPDRPTMGWNPETLEFDVPVPVPAKVLSAVDFMLLFTTSERIAIRSAGDPVLDDFLDMVRAAGTISMDHPMVLQGIAYLQSVGILTPDRAAEIGGA